MTSRDFGWCTVILRLACLLSAVQNLSLQRVRLASATALWVFVIKLVVRYAALSARRSCLRMMMLLIFSAARRRVTSDLMTFLLTTMMLVCWGGGRLAGKLVCRSWLMRWLTF